MKKIKTLFVRDFGDPQKRVINKVTEGCEWVLAGEGWATRKYDGTCCMVKDGQLYKRYDCKRGKNPPFGFIPAQEPDKITGHWPGWVKVDPDDKSNKWYLKAWNECGCVLDDGTYELCGEHVQGNPEKISGGDKFIRHGATILDGVPRDFEGLRQYLSETYMEGIVFYCENGDKAKIKRTDFGLKWGNR